MKIISILYLIIAFIGSVINKRGRTINKIINKLPISIGANPIAISRPITIANPVVVARPVVVRRLAVVRSSLLECPQTHNFNELIDYELGPCRAPCRRETCIQTSDRCCYYSNIENSEY